MLPGIDGFKICSQFKHQSLTKDIPIILMTVLADNKSKIKGFNFGAVDYIIKPINYEELLAMINTHITNQSLLRYSEKSLKLNKLLFDLSDSIRKSLDLNLIFKTATQEILKVLQCDRLALAQLTNEQILIKSQSTVNNQSGKFPDSINIDYICSGQKTCANYRQGEIRAASNINQTELENKAIKAQLIVPILLPENIPKANHFYPLWGWLIAEHCYVRTWQPEEIELCQNIVVQLAIAINQGLLYQQLQQSNKQLQKSNKQLKSTNQKLQRLALVDPLTQVYNRRYFEQQLDQEWRRLKRNSPAHLSLIMCDVDYFKIYNDTYGHQQGDECLAAIANALTKVIKRPADLLARYGGEEFVIILPNTPQAGAIKLAEMMRVAIQNLNLTHVNSLVDSAVTISLGVATTIPDAQDNPSLLIEAADQALYQAKSRGRNRFAVYRGNIADAKQARNSEIQWINRLRQALAKDLFSLYAQPITTLSSNNSKQRFEILLRLTDQKEQIITPDAFLQTATDNLLMPDIDRWVFNHLLKKLEAWDSSNWHNHQFSINLSGTSLNSEPFLDFLSQKLTNSHLSPQTFCFEITETEAISNLKQVSSFINSLKTLGCSFALDDFGKGLSSLSYLKNLPVDYLKIDGSFITEVNKDKASMVMVEAIHHIAQGIGLKTVAEFVEDQDILDAVRNLNVDYAQGYYLGRPKKLSSVLTS